MTLLAIKSFQAIKKKVAKCRKDFYFSKDGKLVKFLGSFGDIIYKEVLKALDEFLLAVPSAAKFDIFDASVCRVNCF